MKYDLKAVAQFSVVILAFSIAIMVMPAINSGVPVA